MLISFVSIGVLSTFHTIGSHMYKFSHNQTLTYSDAESMCTKTGGYLLEINDAEEQKQFEKIFVNILERFSKASKQSVVWVSLSAV